ncbi:MAG: hypothetical protein AAF529_03690 [Pseudomonadota bacterium]
MDHPEKRLGKSPSQGSMIADRVRHPSGDHQAGEKLAKDELFSGEVMHSNERLAQVIAYTSPYLFWICVGLLSAGVLALY